MKKISKIAILLLPIFLVGCSLSQDDNNDDNSSSGNPDYGIPYLA